MHDLKTILFFIGQPFLQQRNSINGLKDFHLKNGSRQGRNRALAGSLCSSLPNRLRKITTRMPTGKKTQVLD
jgi:hypothetical protein